MKAVNARYKIRQNYSTCKSKQMQVFLTETAMAISLSIMAVVMQTCQPSLVKNREICVFLFQKSVRNGQKA